MTMDPHVGDDLLADYLEGLLSADDEARVDAHLAQCPACAAARSSFADLRLLLRDAGTRSVPMPPEVFSRLDAVLATEAQTRTHPRDVVPLRDAARHRRRAARGGGSRRLPRILAAAASVAVLGAAGVVAVTVLDGGATPTAGPQSTPRPTPSPETGPRTYAFKSGVSAPDLSASDFASEVRALVESRPPGPSTDSGEKPFQAQGDRGVAPPSTRCVERVLDAAGLAEPLDTRPARFDGQQVTVAIAPTSKANVVRATAIAGCPGQGARIVHAVTIPVR